MNNNTNKSDVLGQYKMLDSGTKRLVTAALQVFSTLFLAIQESQQNGGETAQTEQVKQD